MICNGFMLLISHCLPIAPIAHCSGMGLSQSMQRLDDPFSDEEGSGYLGSPTRQSYRPHAFSSKLLFALLYNFIHFNTIQYSLNIPHRSQQPRWRSIRRRTMQRTRQPPRRKRHARRRNGNTTRQRLWTKWIRTARFHHRVRSRGLRPATAAATTNSALPIRLVRIQAITI